MATGNTPANGAGLNLGSFTGFARNGSNKGTAPEQQENAEFWLNIGYEVGIVNADGDDELMFVSLARGIPLDSIKPFEIGKTRSSNMAALRDAQNGLHESFMIEARKLEPGESKLLIVDSEIGLSVQIKRVRGEQAAPVENSLRKQIGFNRQPANQEA